MTLPTPYLHEYTECHIGSHRFTKIYGKFTQVREQIYTSSHKFAASSRAGFHKFAQVRGGFAQVYTSLRTDSHQFTQVHGEFTQVCAHLCKFARVWTALLLLQQTVEPLALLQRPPKGQREIVLRDLIFWVVLQPFCSEC